MTATITLFEHEIGEFDWTDRDLAALERLNRAAGVDILRATMRGRQRVVKATQYVGVIRLGKRTIQVLPKIYQSNDVVSQQQRAWEATHNLLCMLEYAGQLPVREHTPGSFELVAAMTGQPEIGQSCFAAFRPWNNVVNSHREPSIGLSGQAIATAMPAFFC